MSRSTENNFGCTDMDSSSNIPRDVLNSSESEEISDQEEYMEILSTSTEGKNSVSDDQDVMSSDDEIPFDSIQSIYSSAEQLGSRITEYIRRLFEFKVEFEKLSVDPSSETLPDEQLVNMLNSAIASKKKFLDEKKYVNSRIAEIKEALKAMFRKPQLPSDVDYEPIDIFRIVGLRTSFEFILAQQMAQTLLFEEIESLSVAISNKLKVKSSAVKQLLCELQSENESVEEMSVQQSQSMILDWMNGPWSYNELELKE